MISRGFMAVFKRFKRYDQEKKQNVRGNAMVYVLLAIALFGILTATLSGQNADSDGQNIDDELVEFYANELLEYSAAAKSVVDQMILTGSTIDDLNFVNPTSAAFDTTPHIHKVFHPAGGGLTYQYAFNENIIGGIPVDANRYPGWFITKLMNVEWTPSTQPEITISALRISQPVCEAINKKITGSINIPSIPNGLAVYFQEDEYTNDLLIADCPGCEGYNTLCLVYNGVTENWYGLYTILAAR